MPIQALVGRHAVGDRVVNGLVRIWAEGDTRRCRLCPACSADHGRGVCAIMTTDDLGAAPEEILLFSAHGRVAPA